MIDVDFDDAQQFANILEALLLAAAKPLTIERITELFDDYARPNPQQIKKALVHLSSNIHQRSYELHEVASGFRLQVRPEYSAWVGRLLEERPQRYSRAMLETLALIAYRQPITRGEIEDVRGVAVNTHIIKTLLERDWIRVVGYKDVPGKPEMLATTKIFLDYFNMRSLDELPNLSALLELQSVVNERAVQETKTADIAQKLASESQIGPVKNNSRISFGTLLEELESMEQGLTTEFSDITTDEDNKIIDLLLP